MCAASLKGVNPFMDMRRETQIRILKAVTVEPGTPRSELVQVIVRDNNVDQALKALKKKMQREGIFREMKLRGHYEKPSERKAREKGGSGAPRPQAGAQEAAARRPVAGAQETRQGRRAAPPFGAIGRLPLPIAIAG